MQKFFIIFFIVLFLVSFFYFNTTQVSATSFSDGLKNTAGEIGYPETDADSAWLPAKIGQIIGAALSFIGVLFLILMIYGGYIWMTARGNEQQTAKAKELITAALIGLVIILAAYAITAVVSRIF